MKGFLRTLEMILASMVILSVLLVIGFMGDAGWDRAGSTILAYSVLETASKSGILDDHLSNNSYTSYVSLYSEIRSLMPTDNDFILTGKWIPKPMTIVLDAAKTTGQLFGPGDIVPFSGMNMTVVVDSGDLDAVLGDNTIYSYDLVIANDSQIEALGAQDYAKLKDYINSGGRLLVVYTGSSGSSTMDISGIGGTRQANARMDVSSSSSYGTIFGAIMRHMPSVSYTSWNSDTFRIEGSVVLNNEYGYSIYYNDSRGAHCVNISYILSPEPSYRCLYEGEQTSLFQTYSDALIGAQEASLTVYEIIPESERVYFIIREQSVDVYRVASPGSFQCMIGTENACALTIRRAGRGYVFWLGGIDLSRTDISAILKSIIVVTNDEVLIHPSVFEKANDVRDRIPEPDSSFSRKASIIHMFGTYPAVISLYVWPPY